MALRPLLGLAALLLLAQAGNAIKLKFKFEECMFYTFNQYEYFYGSFVSMPDVYGVVAFYDMTVTAPSGVKLYEVFGEGESTFHLVPTEAGEHKFCLKVDQEKTASRYIIAREVLWNINIGIGDHHDKVQESDTQYLWHHVYQLESQINELKSTLHYLYWRERRHRQTVESTHQRVLYFALARAAALIGVAVTQVLVVRRMFSK
jgi:hypothetical protein